MIFTSKLTPFILATLIKFSAPGNSMYSQVPMGNCDETCQATLLCENAKSPSCKPKFSQDLYDQYYSEFISQEITPELAAEQAKPLSFTRKETYEEGLARYAIIAESLAIVSQNASRRICNSTCNELASDGRTGCDGSADSFKNQCHEYMDSMEKECHNDCTADSPWLWSRKELAYMVATVIGGESGMRADVHGGTGKFGRGDCQWQKNGRRVAAWTTGAYPIKDTCTSFGLAQHRVVKGAKGKLRHFDWTGEQLLGVDMQSTIRSLTVASKDMSMAKNYCLKMSRADRKDMPKLTFAAYGSGNSCIVRRKKMVTVDGKKERHYAYQMPDGIEWGLVPPDNAVSKTPLEHLRPAQRSKIFWDNYSHPKSLNQRAKLGLKDPKVIKAFETLRDSKQQIFWMTPIE